MGMSLAALAESDLGVTIEALGVPMILESPSGAIYELCGHFNRIGLKLDPETGLMVPGLSTSGSVRLSRFPLTDLPQDGWTFQGTDITGAIVRGQIHSVMLDRTIGIATFLVRR